MNLKPKNQPVWHELFHKDFVAVYIALVLVLLINQLVFGLLLKDREQAKAFTSTLGSQIFNTLTGGKLMAGTNNVLVADFWFPDGYTSNGIACDYNIPGNPCFFMVDADGIDSTLAGPDDDGITNFFQLVPPNKNILSIIPSASENICTDSLTAPTCVYYDPTSACDNNGGVTYVIDNGACAARGIVSDTLVSLGSNWGHSEWVSANGKWDYCGGPTELGCSGSVFNNSGTLLFENGGVCGISNGAMEADVEPTWDDSASGDGVWTPNVDVVYWDPSGCLSSTGNCASAPGGCTGTAIKGGNPVIPLFLDDATATCGSAIAGDGIWQYPEPIWDDIASNDGDYDDVTTPPADLLIWDPASCIQPGYAGSPLVTATKLTETLWRGIQTDDSILVQGSNWNNGYAGQWQGDLPGLWDIGGIDTFVDFTNPPPFIFTGAEPVIKDLDADSKYTSQADILMDADGGFSSGIGTDDDAIPAATNLNGILPSDRLCYNTLGVMGFGQVILYVDGSPVFDCIPGNGGTDILIRDDVGSGLPAPVAVGTFPYTFSQAAFFIHYNDADFDGNWDYCDPIAMPACAANAASASAATESLWMSSTGASFNFQPNTATGVESDGTASLVTYGSGGNVDDDIPGRGAIINYLQPSDNVCYSYPTASLAIEDIYVDQTGDCIPSNDPACVGGMPCAHPNLLQDVTGDALNPAAVFGGTWVSAAGTLSYQDWDSSTSYTWGASAAATETIWLSIDIFNGKYSVGADIDVYNTVPTLYSGDNLVSLQSAATGPSGYQLIFSETNGVAGLSSGDTILEDNGNVQTGPVGAPGNSVIDRRSEMINYWTIKNAGTATGADIPRLYLWGGTFFGNGICDLGVGPGADDNLLGTMNWNPTTSSWDYDGTGSGTGIVSRLCISADINTFATGGRTFIPQIPLLTDGLGPNNGLHDSGEVGWFFYSQNDGPSDAAITLPYTFTISALPSYGTRSAADNDTNPPGIVNNIVIKASSNGAVNLTWQDPTDTDLSQILLEEKVNGQVLGDYIAKGVQVKTLTGRIVGNAYSYRLRAVDNNSNIGIGQYYSIVIPATGETQADVQALPSPEETPNLILQDPTPAGPLPVNVSVGALVKAAYSGTIYFIDQDNRRHTFPNEKVYFSYYPDFSNLQILPDATLAAIPLGSNVTMRPGTWLVKIQSDFKVYAVEPYGVLRWISSEAVAAGLYGATWSTRVVDVEPTFFTDYQMGSVVTANVHPTGTVFSYLNDSKVYYVDQTGKRFISSAVFINNKFQNKFVVRNISTDIAYANGADWPNLGMDEIMTLK